MRFHLVIHQYVPVAADLEIPFIRFQSRSLLYTMRSHHLTGVLAKIEPS
ncbi:MAG: hypothetical protein AAFR31_00470 [Cyanobacteria bacterium J06627_8]